MSSGLKAFYFMLVPSFTKISLHYAYNHEHTLRFIV